MRLPTTALGRVVLLISAVLALGAGLAGAYTLRQWQRDRQAQQQLDEGLAAYEKKDYRAAMLGLNQYIKRNPNDSVILEKLARARLEVPEKDGSHFSQAVNVLRRLRSLSPENEFARSKLLEIYVSAQQNTEALSLAEEILSTQPDSLDALRAKATALSRTGKFADAMKEARKCVERETGDMAMQVLILEMELRESRDPQKVLAQAEAVKKQLGDDPRGDLLLAYAHRLAGDRAMSLAMLQAAAKSDLTDETSLTMLVHLLDEAGMVSISLGVLEKIVDSKNDPLVRYELLKRLWEAGEYPRFLERMPAEEVERADTAVELIGLRAMALYLMNRREEAEATLARLEQRESAGNAKHWVDVLRTVHSEQPAQASEVMKICRTALKDDPENAYFRCMLGNAYASQGEPEPAMDCWRQAIKNRPLWVLPRLRLAAVLTELKRAEEALPEAQAAATLAPRNLDAAVIWTLARAANLQRNPADSPQKLLELVSRIRLGAPADERLIPLEVQLTVQAGSGDEREKLQRVERAGELIKSLLAAEKPLRQETLLRLATISRELGLDTEEACEEKIRQVYGQTVQQVVAAARELAASGKTTEGLRLLEEQIASAGNEQRAAWRLARAQLLEQARDPRAAENWIELATEYKNEVSVLQAALRSPLFLANPTAAADAIRDLKSLSGEESVAPQVAEARLKLVKVADETEEDADRRLSAAAEILGGIVSKFPLLVEPRLLLAQVNELRGREGDAIQDLRAAGDRQPDSLAIAMSLARLYQKGNDLRQANLQLDNVLAHPAAGLLERMQAAELLALQGSSETDSRAIQVLEGIDGVDGSGASMRDELLAALYLRNQQYEKLEALCPRLRQTPSRRGIQTMAGYYALQRRQDEAEQALQLLETLELPPGERESIMAYFQARFGKPDRAIESYRAAVGAAPKEVRFWNQLIVAHVLTGNGTEAIQAADDALKNLAEQDSARIRFFREHSPLVERFAADELLRPFVALLMHEPGEREAAAELLDLAAEIEAETKGTSDVKMTGLELLRVDPDKLDKVGRLARRHDDSVALQNLLVKLYLPSRFGTADPYQLAKALEIARHTMDRFRDDTESAWLTADLLRVMQRFSDALPVAEEWRRRAFARPLPADLMITDTQLRLGHVQEAFSRIEPYLDEAKKDPDANMQVILHHARALIQENKIEEVEQLLEPLLERSASWRRQWMGLAVLAMADDKAATCTAWLEKVTEKIDEADIEELVALAEAWNVLFVRFNDSQMRDRAVEIVDRATARPDATHAAWSLKGILAESQGNPELAADCYRRSMALFSENHLALNNLAMILVRAETDLPAAEAHARRAVAIAPAVGDYHDTLGQVLYELGKYAEAVKEFTEAIALEPKREGWSKRLEDAKQKLLEGESRP